MEVETAAKVLAGSILTGLSFIVFVITIVIINNIIHKYWKPIKLFTPDSWAAFDPPAIQKPEQATDHNLACTGSNEPGQPGSRY
jgi:hypothetical protein